LERYKASSVTSVVFGDIFREDLMKYRTLNLARLGIKAIFPLWKRDNLQLMDTFISLGFKAIVTSINASRLDDRFVGRTIDWQFMRDFPASANISGEWGEYHTFVYDGPTFQSAVPYTVGDIFERDDGFHQFKSCDLIPA
jgi:diphthamide synthase (EF-2-diphthine--ammonia ligase)